MASITVDCPYCSVETPTSIPDDAEIKKVSQNYRTGIWGDANKTEAECEDGHHFAVKYKNKNKA